MAKILILEDDRDINTLIKMHLAKEGYEIVQAYDGKEAIEQFDTSIDLAILDIMVPYLNGFKVLEHIRQFSEAPVLFLTATNDDANKILALGMGADDYVTKPFSVIEIVYRVKAHLRRYLDYTSKSDSQQATLTNGPLHMDLDQMKVYINDTLLSLNPKEIKLLSFFMSNLGQVFTKKQLYEQVWEDAYYEDDNTIMVHISRLRDKIEVNPKAPLFIITIKGLGYRMEAL